MAEAVNQFANHQVVWLPVQAKIVKSTGTTATNLVGCY
jgi:hypothetical protein